MRCSQMRRKARKKPMHEFSIPADKLYAYAPKLFFSLLPECEVNFVNGSSQMFLNVKNILRDQPKKTARRTLISYIVGMCGDDQLARFTAWLTEYFSEDMQHHFFELTVSADGKIIPDPMLERALDKIKTKRKRY